MTSEGTFPIGAKHQEPQHPFGLPGIQAALLSHHVRPSGTHQSLSMPARNRASARALPVLNMHNLCPWGESSKLDPSYQPLAVAELISALMVLLAGSIFWYISGGSFWRAFWSSDMRGWECAVPEVRS